MGLRVIDHTDEWWTKRKKRTGRENGANTYSRDIVTHHVGRWAKLAHNQEVVVSTAPPLVVHDIGPVDLVIQYLHSYDYATPLLVASRVRAVLEAQGVRRILFVAAYRPLVAKLVAEGFEAVYIPMRVDVDWVRHRAGPERTRFGPGRAVYFGNVTAPKRTHYDAFRRAFVKAGWKLDLLTTPDQGKALRQVRRYAYGIGVGRCALEMMGLGMRVMLSGQKFGGIITNADEFAVQSSQNFNGRVITYDRTVGACVEAWDQVPDWSEAVDTYTAVGVLDQHVNRLLL